MTEGRRIYFEILKNFINSLKPRSFYGELRGKDRFGTEYYEGRENPHRGKRRRWFKTLSSDDFQQEIPPEWEAWLRYKRRDPPTEEEIQMNIQKMQNIIENAKRLEQKRQNGSDDKKTTVTGIKFPVYEEYNSDPSNLTKK